MEVQIDLPAACEEELRRRGPDAGRYITEVLGVQWYREGFLSHYGLSQMLGLDQNDTEQVLRRYKVLERTLTDADLDAEREVYVGPPNVPSESNGE